MGNLSCYIDESGIITNTYNENHRYFIVVIVATTNAKKLRKRFKDSRLRAIKNHPSLFNELKNNKEIKGNDINEEIKSIVYKDLIRFAKQNKGLFEIGIILLDNKKIKPIFREKKARSFNYLLGLYFKWRCSKTIDNDENGELTLMIDERNVATGSRMTLQDYLNTELRLNNKKELFNNEIKVGYCDSKNENLVQLADILANTVFRSLNDNAPDSLKAKENIEKLTPTFTNKRIFKFPL